MIEIKPSEKKDVTLSIKTVVIDPTQRDISDEQLLSMLKRIVDGDEVGEDEIEELLEEDERSEIELCTEATLSMNNKGGVEICYMENEDDETLKTRSKIIFNTRDSGLVAMTKEGAMKAFLSFEEGKTHICTYDTPFMPIKVYVTASKVENRLLESGRLRLNYVLDLNDTPSQHFMVDVKIKESTSDILDEIIG